MNNGARLALAGLGLLLSACQMVGPDYQVPGDAAVQRKDLQGQLSDANHQRSALIAQSRKESHDALLEGRKIIAAGVQDQIACHSSEDQRDHQ